MTDQMEFMDHKLDVQQALSVFNKIVTHGSKLPEEDGGYELDGMKATQSADGYTVMLDNGRCKVTLQFHNTYSVEMPSRSEFDAFLEQLEHIDQTEYD